MNRENSNKLINIHPPFFADLDPREPFYMFGFECDDGWFNLLERMLHRFKVICERDELLMHIVQIKEKYGTLRVYLDHYSSSLIEQAINEAEFESSVTCEYCGKPGNLTGRGWYITLCDECLLKKNSTV